jgi:hypothetical protein
MKEYNKRKQENIKNTLNKDYDEKHEPKSFIKNNKISGVINKEIIYNGKKRDVFKLFNLHNKYNELYFKLNNEKVNDGVAESYFIALYGKKLL